MQTTRPELPVKRLSIAANVLNGYRRRVGDASNPSRLPNPPAGAVCPQGQGRVAAAAV